MRKWSQRNSTPVGPIFPVRSACLVSRRRGKATRTGRRRHQRVPGNLCIWPSCRATLSHREVSYKPFCASRTLRRFRGHAIVTNRCENNAMRCTPVFARRIISRNWERRAGRSCRRKLNEQTLARDKRDDIVTRCETTLSVLAYFGKPTSIYFYFIFVKSFMELSCSVNMIYIYRLHTFAYDSRFMPYILHFHHYTILYFVIFT